MENYGREPRMGAEIRKKEKIENIIEFVERIKKIQKEAGAALRKVQEEIKQQINRGGRKSKDRRKETK